MPFDDPNRGAASGRECSSAASAPSRSRSNSTIDIDGLHVVELRRLDAVHRAAVIETLVDTYRAAWGDCTEAYSSRERTREHLQQRLDPQDSGATFVALTRRGEIAGTGSIARDDYYDGFSASNGVDPGHVGRDLYTMPPFRGVAIHGLKVWMHLLQARLEWVIQRGAAQMTVFTEAGRVDLAALYARLGAAVHPRRLGHRELGADAITMLVYPAIDCLDRLRDLRRSAPTASPAWRSRAEVGSRLR